MVTWLRGLALALGLLCVMGLAQAQALTEAQRAQQEQEADALFTQGEGRMKVASYEEAIAEFRNVLRRYPDTQVRYKAQFRMADALVSLKKEPDALELLQSVVKEESPDWSPKALMRIGEIFASEQKYTEAFRAYRQVITDYPTSPTVDHAYFSIGVTHFRLGHFEQAAKELDKVGTVYAASIADLQRVSPGEPLYVRLTEPNMVAAGDTTIPVTITTKSGDTETVELKPEVEGGDHFGAVIQTELGAPKVTDHMLQMHGNDIVTLAYKSRYVGGGSVDKTLTMTIASNARLTVRDPEGNEVRGAVIGDTMILDVNDPDRDLTDDKDTIQVELKSKKKDSEKMTLTETDVHTGVFRGSIKVMRGEPTPDNGIIETNANLAEGSATQYDDTVTISYQDENNLAVQDTGPRKVTAVVLLFAASQGSLTPVEHDISKADLAIKALLYKGRSLTQIAATYRDLGQDAIATITFRKAAEQFQEILGKYPNAPEVEDAMYGLFQNYVEMDQYESAIGVINQITRRFPQSTRASEAMLEMGALHVKREEYDRALAIYFTLAQSVKGTPLAEEAQYNICTTYMAMFKPKPGDVTPPPVSRDQVTASLEEFARNYPNSERTPEALWQLVRFRYDGEDYRGATDGARRMEALYPDNVMTGRVLLLQGQAQYKLRDIDGAVDTFQKIIANYGGEADAAGKFLAEIQKKFGTKSTTGSSGTSTTDKPSGAAKPATKPAGSK